MWKASSRKRPQEKAILFYTSPSSTARILSGICGSSEGAASSVSAATDHIRACDPKLAKALSEILSEMK